MKKVPISRRYYEPIPNETHKAWLAFCVYRDMGWDRSLDKAYRQMHGKMDGRHARHWATWSKQNRWVTRAEAFDEAVAKRQRKVVEDARVAKYQSYFDESW